jgi:hypothetical protein
MKAILMLSILILVGCGREEAQKTTALNCPSDRLVGTWKGGSVEIELKASCEAVEKTSGAIGHYETSYPTWILIDFGATNYGCNGSPAYPAPLQKLTCFDQAGAQLELTK